MKRMGGWLIQLCYKLENHAILQVSLKNWMWAGVIAPLIAAAMRRLSWWAAVPISLASLLLWAGIALARKRGHLLFEPAFLGPRDADRPPLRADERVAGWASGPFAVEGKRKYLINEAAHISFVPTREHIVMAQVRRTRFLLLCRSRPEEAGWWYAFLKPQHVQRVETGYILRGVRMRPGMALTYWPEEERNRTETIYLAFADVPTALHVLADLCVDVPAQSFSPLCHSSQVDLSNAMS